MNWVAYASLSVLGAAVCIGNGYAVAKEQPNANTWIRIVTYMLSSKFNILVMVNLAYTILLLFGKLVQAVFFGKLREVEYKNINDRLLNYILLKILFIGAMMDPNFYDLIVWASWFSILGFMKIFSLLTRDRFEYITTFNPNTPKNIHIRLLTLLGLILVFDITWFYICITVFKETAQYSELLLLTFECFTLFLDTIQTLIKYIIHLVDIGREGVWEQRGTYIYYTEFCTDTLILLATLGHYIQILILHGISFTLIDAILLLNMRVVFNNLREKITAYRNYRKLAQNMRDRYPDVPPEELESLEDVCAICHDKMEAAKKLPCSHIFHHSCLRSWLENHHNCPTCRYSLIDTSAGPAGPAQQQGNPNQPRPREEIFRFNGQRWFPWLPTIQVVSERRGGQFPVVRGPPQEAIQRVQEVFPHIPAQVIAFDLMQTHSVELTIENFIEGRIPNVPNVPPPVVNNNNNNNLPPSPSSPVVRSSTPPPPSSPPVNVELPKLSDEFARTPEERQTSLQRRKQEMLERARRQFIDKMEREKQPEPEVIEPQVVPTPAISSMESPTPTTHDPAERRRLMLEAAQRRAEMAKKEQ